jgi:riboflavin synthase
MFTGLVAALGQVVSASRSSQGARIAVATPLASQLRRGDSIAVNGVCLTAAEVDQDRFAAEVMNESLAHTSLGDIDAGARVNLELPLRASDRLGGHVVQGHVDGLGAVVSVAQDGFARRVRIQAPAPVLRYVVPKGPIAVDGVSLTVAERDEQSFTVSLVPQTLGRTNLDRAVPGTQVNLEVDVLAKYVEQLTQARA